MSPQANAPQKIGRYEVTGELGKGAMGLVYKALDPMIGRTVAMKTMRMDVHGMEAEEMLKRFQNEARAAGVLNQRNIVTIFDAGEQDGMFYIAMELIEGVTLHSLIAQGRVLPVEQIIDVSRQVLAGLDYAHSHGVIHRDVKPANIMIMPDETVKIMDFGIAKAGGGLTSAGQVLGTPNYMSPEQVKGRTLDGRSDLFSFGVILYEMVTGEKPFTGQNVTTIIYKIVNEEPIPPRELDVTIHPGLSEVITRALAKNPDDRYQSGALLAKDLANYKGLAQAAAGAPAAGAGNAQASDKTTAFDSQAMAARMGSGSMPAQPNPPAPAAAPPAEAPAAKAPMKGIDSTVGLQRKPAAPAAAKSSSKGLLIGGAVLALLLVAGGSALWVRQRAAGQQAAQQQRQSAPSPAATTPEESAPATPVTKPKAAPPKPSAQQAKPGTTPVTPSTTAPTTGELQISSTPSGAQVQVDGATSGTTPFSAHKLAPGPHTVVVSKAGFPSATRVISVTAGKTTPLVVNFASAPTATIKLTSQPAGAAIFLDGKDSGKVTPAQLSTDPGEHKLLLRKAGFKDATMTTPKLTAGQNFDFAPLLQAGKNDENPFKKLFGGGIPEGKGVANFKTNPKGAEVMMNGYSAPKPTPCKLPLDPGTYKVTFQLSGYKPMTKNVTIEKGKTVEVDVTLEKK